MKALSIRQPTAYLAGCLLGDAWLSAPQMKSKHGYLCLRCADLDFAEAFASSITAGFGVPAKVTVDERGYFLVRKSNGGNRFAVLGGYEPVGIEQKAAWLRGFFDSEGCVTLAKKPTTGPNSWDRRIVLTSTNVRTLHMVKQLLMDLNIRAVRYGVRLTEGHKGTKPVFNLQVVGGLESFVRFAASVGSNIGRKQSLLEAMVASYHPDLSQAYRDAQAKGAAARDARGDAAATAALPIVVAAIRDMAAAGQKTTLRACWRIQHYWRARKHHSHAELVQLAKENKCAPCL